MKILILANDTTYTYNLRNELIEKLIECGHKVVIASKILLFAEELNQMGCRLIDIESDRRGTNPFSDIQFLLRVHKILKTEKPDIVLTYNIKPNVYGGIACQITKTCYIPNITGLGKAVEYPGVLQRLSLYLYKRGVAGADCVFFQNISNLKFFEEHNILKRNSKVRILPGSGVSLKAHKPMEYPEETEGIHFLFVARILKEKGIDLYLQAARRISDIYPFTTFHICGKCDDEKYVEILDHATKEKYVIYHGEQKNMIPYFEKAHCIVHPSYYPEGMSNVLLEAAAHCRPIITTNRPGCRETVNDSRSGFVIPIQDEDTLVDALEKFVTLPWSKKRDMGLEGRFKIENEFDRRFVVDIYIEEIERIYKKKLISKE